MRWAVEYELPSGSVGLCIFSAEDLHAAQAFVDEMQTQYGHDHVFNLNELANGAGIEELYRLFPRLASIVNRGDVPRKSSLLSWRKLELNYVGSHNTSYSGEKGKREPPREKR